MISTTAASISAGERNDGVGAGMVVMYIRVWIVVRLRWLMYVFHVDGSPFLNGKYLSCPPGPPPCPFHFPTATTSAARCHPPPPRWAGGKSGGQHPGAWGPRLLLLLLLVVLLVVVVVKVVMLLLVVVVVVVLLLLLLPVVVVVLLLGSRSQWALQG